MGQKLFKQTNNLLLEGRGQTKDETHKIIKGNHTT